MNTHRAARAHEETVITRRLSKGLKTAKKSVSSLEMKKNANGATLFVPLVGKKKKGQKKFAA